MSCRKKMIPKPQSRYALLINRPTNHEAENAYNAVFHQQWQDASVFLEKGVISFLHLKRKSAWRLTSFFFIISGKLQLSIRLGKNCFALRIVWKSSEKCTGRFFWAACSGFDISYWRANGLWKCTFFLLLKFSLELTMSCFPGRLLYIGQLLLQPWKKLKSWYVMVLTEH